MDIILYNTSSPPNVVNKNLGSSSLKIENVIFKEENALSVLRPKLLIHLTANVSQLAKYNYLKIPQFNRYYFFEIGETRGGLLEIQCISDPLMSFKEDIIDTRSNAPKQYIIRSEKFTNKLLVDTMLPMMSDHTFDIKTFGDPVYNNRCNNVILETIGKGGTPS